MSLTVYIAAAAAGTGLSAAGLVMLFFSFRRGGKSFEAPERAKPQTTIKEAMSERDRKALLGAGVGALVGVSLAWGTGFLFPAILLGAGLGFLAPRLIDNFLNSSKEFKLTKEVALLYESVDLFLRAGFTVRQALGISRSLVPNLAGPLDKCLNRWPAGPLLALEHLGADIGLQQADMLVGLLMQAEEGGPEKVEGIMAQEAVRIEELRQALAEGRIAKKPIYSTVYLFLPVVAVIGIIMGPLAYRAIQMIMGLSAAGM